VLQDLSNDMAGVMDLFVDSGLAVSLATFWQPPTTRGATGNISGAYAIVPSMANIACMDAPESVAKIMANEDQSEHRIESGQFRHVLLAAYYSFAAPAETLGWRVDIDGTMYDLLAAESDSQRTQTRIRLKAVTL
jgi:hypothetical protein